MYPYLITPMSTHTSNKHHTALLILPLELLAGSLTTHESSQDVDVDDPAELVNREVHGWSATGYTRAGYHSSQGEPGMR